MLWLQVRVAIWCMCVGAQTLSFHRSGKHSINRASPLALLNILLNAPTSSESHCPSLACFFPSFLFSYLNLEGHAGTYPLLSDAPVLQDSRNMSPREQTLSWASLLLWPVCYSSLGTSCSLRSQLMTMRTPLFTLSHTLYLLSGTPWCPPICRLCPQN